MAQETKLQFYVICWRNGEIDIVTTPRKGSMVLAKHEDKQLLEQILARRARKAYDGETWLVPGLPEAETEIQQQFAAGEFSAKFNEVLEDLTMKRAKSFEMTVCEPSSGTEWTETIKRQSLLSKYSAKKLAEHLIEMFNKTIKHEDSRRELIHVQLLPEADIKAADATVATSQPTQLS